jgi:hypothetical protein
LCNLWKLAERDRLVLLIVKGEKRPACGISFGAVSKAGNGNGEGGRGRESYRGNLQSYYTKTESEEEEKRRGACGSWKTTIQARETASAAVSALRRRRRQKATMYLI